MLEDTILAVRERHLALRQLMLDGGDATRLRQKTVLTEHDMLAGYLPTCDSLAARFGLHHRLHQLVS